MPPISSNKKIVQAAEALKKETAPRGSLWKGPIEDGITYSMLARFLGCRERFRIAVVEGLRPHDEFNHRIEYGQMWHVCEEALATRVPAAAYRNAWDAPLYDYAKSLTAKYPTQQQQISHWFDVCTVQFPLYVGYWQANPDVRERIPLLQEKVFNVPYLLPSGRTVRLRGKWDSVDVIGKGKGAGIYLQENKTKGDINPMLLQRQLTFDLQTMMYLVALRSYSHDHPLRDEVREAMKHNGPVGINGVRYNVVRRPLSGGKGSIVQHKPSKSNPQGESRESFLDRLSQIISEDASSYFMRWKAEVTGQDIERFQVRCLNPLLEQVCDWWEMIDGCTPGYDLFQATPGLHWQHPFGLYNVLDEGGATDLDEYLRSGDRAGLTRVDKLFTELEP